MKQTVFAFLLLLSAALQCKAQTWAPLGMTWKYEAIRDMWTPGDWRVHTLKAIDTVTRYGKRCTIIRDMTSSVTDTSQLGIGYSFLTYEESGVVYLLSPITKKFTVLYDFNKKAGESWSIYGIPKWRSTRDTQECPITVIVDSVKTVDINGFMLRKLFLSAAGGTLAYAFDGVIIEGIGHLRRPYPWNTCIYTTCTRVTDCMQHYAGLRCIDNGEIGFHDFKIAPYCEWTDIDEQQVHAGYQLYPNPSNGSVTLKFATPPPKNAYTLKIRNTLGQMALSQKISQPETLITVSWPSGVYFYQIDAAGLPAGNGKIVVP